MPRYLNTSGATLTFQGVTFKPGDIHDVPNPIHSRIMYPTNLPCTKSSNNLDILNSETAENISDINETIESNKPKTKSKTNIKEEKDGTNNNK